MERIKNLFKTKLPYILAFVCIIFMLCTPLMQYRVNISDDYLFHFSRIQSITDSLKQGIFPVKVHFPMGNTSGYGTGLFYPNLFLYIPALINLVISNIGLTYKLFLVIILSALYLISYFSIKTVTKNSKTALFSTLLIMCSNGLMLNLYDRTATGELLGFLFITPIICGLYNYVHDDFDKPYLLAIGFLGVANSHLITTLICIIFSILYFLVNIKSTIKNPKKFLKLIITAIIVILISAAFWIPMLEQLSVQTYKLSKPWTSIKDDKYNIVDLLGVGKYSIGIILTIFVPIFILGIIDKNVEKSKKLFPIFALGFMLLMICSPFWNITNTYSNMIQFKWRLLGITTILSCISIPLFVEYYANKFNIKFNLLFAFITLVSIALCINHMIDVINHHNKAKSEYIETVIYTIPESIGGGQEYLPIETDYDYILENSFIVTTDSGVKTGISKENFKGTFFIEDFYNAKSVEVPFVYYLGYVSNITSPDGQTVTPLQVEKSENGLLKIILPDGLYGTINVWYDGTDLQDFSYFISIGTVILVLISYIVYKYRKIKKAST